MSTLPICGYEDSLIATVKESDCTVIIGETGCGKTTQFSQFLHKAGYTRHGLIGITQPRRVAAISVAKYVAKELGAPLGGLVGYQVRFDDCTSRDTAIKYVTDGCLLREMLEDKQLSRYSVLVLDEAHERSLATDILFGLVKELLRKKQRSRQLKVVIMSATLNTEKFSSFFNSCPVVEIPGRVFPVSINYAFPNDKFDEKQLTYMQHIVSKVMEIHFEQPTGDVLVFLTGQWEIENTCDRLFKAAESIDYDEDVMCSDIRGLLILPLYGSMATEQQQKVFDPAEDGVRRVIVATNIAATSITIDGVVYVLDCGYIKQTCYNPRTALDCLEVVPISKSEAKQRTGRAGRTQEGRCLRLYSEQFYSQLMEATIPELQRASLTSVMLSLKCMGIRNVLQFDYLDPPSEKMILEALKQLYYFQAIDADGQVTKLGHQLGEYPLQPSLSRVLIRSKQLGCSDTILPIVAMLSVEGIMIKPSGKKRAAQAEIAHRRLAGMGGGNSDFATLLAVYKSCFDNGDPRGWCKDNFVHWRALKMAQSICDQLKTILSRQDVGSSTEEATGSLGELVRQSLCYGLYSHVARKTASGHSFRTMDGHSTTVYLHPSSVLHGNQQLDWVLYHELLDTGKTNMYCVCPIRYGWVKDLLPLLHDVDQYRLSECEVAVAREPLPSISDIGEGELGAKRPRTKSSSEEVIVDAKMKADKLLAAKQRYLNRKKASVV